MGKAGLIGFGGDIALVVGPFIHSEDMYLFAVHLEIVDKLCQGDVGFWLRVAQNQGDLSVVLRGLLNPRKQGCNQNRVGIHHHFDLKIRVGVLFQVLTADFAKPFADLSVLKGHIIAGDKVKVGRRIKFNVH